MAEILDELQRKTKKGYDYEGAEASFELLVHKILNKTLDYFEPVDFKVITQGVAKKGGETEAMNKIMIRGEQIHTVAEGNGPINALNISLKKALIMHYPEIEHITLRDYKVRIVDGTSATKAITRVLIESIDERTNKGWSTVGVSTNVIKASWKALIDSFEYFLYTNDKDRGFGE
jgi:2-isopropylmalate synthase